MKNWSLEKLAQTALFFPGREDDTPLEILRGSMGPFCVNLFKTMTFAAGSREASKGNDDAIIKRGLKSLSTDETFLSV